MKRLTPIQSIKQYCKVDCCCNDLKSWKECNRPKCPLFSFRLGKRPVKINEQEKHRDSPILLGKSNDFNGGSEQ